MVDVRALRNELKLSQAELAERLGLHQTTISRFETGDMPVDRRTELALLALKTADFPSREMRIQRKKVAA